MKKLFVIIGLASVTVFGACSNRAKEEALAKEQALIRIKAEKPLKIV